MKFSVKLCCIAFLTVGLALPACKKQQSSDQKDQGAPEEAAGAEQAAPADQEGPTAVDEQAPGSDEQAGARDDAGPEGQADAGGDQAADEGQDEAPKAGQNDKSAAKKAGPSGPPSTGNMEGTLGGPGIKKGKVSVSVRDDYTAQGSLQGMREGARFLIPLSGKVDKGSNSISMQGKRGNNSATFKGTVTNSGVSGVVDGKIHSKDFKARVSID